MWGQNPKHLLHAGFTFGSITPSHRRRVALVNSRGLAPAPPNSLKVSAWRPLLWGTSSHPQTQAMQDHLSNSWIIHSWVKVTEFWGKSVWCVVKCLDYMLSEIWNQISLQYLHPSKPGGKYLHPLRLNFLVCKHWILTPTLLSYFYNEMRHHI